MLYIPPNGQIVKFCYKKFHGRNNETIQIKCNQLNLFHTVSLYVIFISAFQFSKTIFKDLTKWHPDYTNIAFSFFYSPCIMLKVHILSFPIFKNTF